MELQVGVNSYMTLDEAKQFIDDYILTDAVTEFVESLSDNYISKIINRATKQIENLDFKGVRVDSEQKLKFPRYVEKGREKVLVSCPEDIKIGIVLQAVYDSYFANKDEIQLKKLGVSSYNVDGASISFNNSVSDGKLRNGIYNDIYIEYIRKYTIYV